MIDLEQFCYDAVKKEMSRWDEEDIYAVSFFVESNEANTYGDFSNMTLFAVSCNAESDCGRAKEYSEKRWNYAYWRQDECYIIDPYAENTGADLLFRWYEENNILDMGEATEDDDYDADGNYIGKGPKGHYELLQVAARVARRLQEEKFLQNKFHKIIPIIVHGLEYAWYDLEATRYANQNGEADVFLEAIKRLGIFE